MTKLKRQPVMDGNLPNVNVEDPVFSSKNLSSNLQPIEFINVETKVKVEFIAEDTDFTCELVPSPSTADHVKEEILAESVDDTSEDSVSPAESIIPDSNHFIKAGLSLNISDLEKKEVKIENVDYSSGDSELLAENLLLDSGHFIDTGAIVEEENVAECFKEGKSSRLDFEACRLFKSAEDLHSHGESSAQRAGELSKGKRLQKSILLLPIKGKLFCPEREKNGTLPAVWLSDSEKPFLCAGCGASFKARSLFKRHLVTIHRKPLSCPYCLASFSVHGHLQTHLATHLGAKLFSCKKCSATFLNQNHLVEHLVGYSNVKSYPCVYCSHVFVESDELRIHLTAHVDEECNSSVGRTILPHPCDLCLALLSDGKTLKTHMAYHKNRLNLGRQSSATSTVTECLEPDNSSQKARRSSSSSKKRSKTRRIYCETGEQAGISFRCGVCPLRFETEAFLQKHFVTHLENVPLICDQCGLKFARQDFLKQHMLFHSKRNVKQKPFTCPHCVAKFENIIDFQKHTISHLDPSEKKTFVCPHCPSTFQSGEHLTRHLVVHSNDELYWCVP